MRPRILFVMAAIVLASAVSVQAVTYDAYAEFSTTTNTASSTWQYIETNTVGLDGGYTIIPTYGVSTYHGPAWAMNPFGSDTLVQANGGTVKVGPDWNGTDPKAAVLGWRSPGTGLVEEIRFSVAEISTQVDSSTIPRDGVDYYLYRGSDSALLASGYVGGTLSSGPITLPTDFAVATGDMLYLQVGPGAVNHWYDYAAVTFQVDGPVPEPSSLILLACGLLSLLAYAWRKRK